MSTRSGETSGPVPNGSSIANVLRVFREPSEEDKPYVPLVGGTRLFILLLYATVLIATSLEFFADMNVWYGSWELYNTYVFTVSGIFVLLGMVMLLSSRRTSPDDYDLPVPRQWLWAIGFFVLCVSGASLAIGGDSLGGWAVPLSVALLYGFILLVFASESISLREGYRLALYGSGMVLMILIPVHEAFGVARSPDNDPWTLINLVLLSSGMLLALFALQSLKSKDGFLGAWLMGAMAIFLIAFHEQLGIVASGDYSPYDRMLALIGVTFSFLPLAMYVWREKVYIFLWRRLRTANILIASGDYRGSLKHSEEALKQCYRAGIEDRFSLPWTLKADAQYRMKNYDKAKVNYETALTIDPNDSVSWCHMGNMYAFEGKQEAALRAFDEALKVDPTNAIAWNNKGAVYQSLKMDQDAVICFSKALQNDPNNFDAHINMARLLARLGHSDEALPHYQAALDLRPESEIARQGIQREFHRGMCLDQIKGWEQLGLDTSQLRRILDDDPANFVRRSKAFMKELVEERSQLPVVPGKEHIDMNAAIQVILRVTEAPGAALDTIVDETHLSQRDIILPLALLMETDHVHFKSDGQRHLYVSKGKAPEKPPEPPPMPPKEEKPPPSKVQIVEIKCPGCGLVLKGDESRCPRCDLPLETASLDCPICGEDVPFTAEACPKCGAVFRSEALVKAAAPAPPPEKKEEPPAEVKEKPRRLWSRKKEKPAKPKVKPAPKPKPKPKPKKAPPPPPPPPPEEKKKPPKRIEIKVEPSASILVFRRRKK